MRERLDCLEVRTNEAIANLMAATERIDSSTLEGQSQAAELADGRWNLGSVQAGIGATRGELILRPDDPALAAKIDKIEERLAGLEGQAEMLVKRVGEC